MRILMYAINGKGMGHLNRTTILARSARLVDPSVDIRFVVGSPLFGLVSDAGFEVVKVPDRHHPLGFFAGMAERPTHFARLFRQLLEHYHPDVFVTDFAVNAALFSDAKRLGATLAVVLRKQRRADLRRLVLTPCVRHVDRFLLPHSPSEWPSLELPTTLRQRAVHLGNVVRTLDETRAAAVRARYASPEERLVVVTIGGGGYREAFPLLGVGAEAAAAYTHDAAGKRVRWVLVYGPYYPSDVPDSDEQVQRIRYEADLPELMFAADAVVCNAGYNTVSEVQLSGTPAVVVPRRTHGRDDQVERATVLAESGRALLAEEDAQQLLDAVRQIVDLGAVQRTPVRQVDTARDLGETFLRAVAP